MVRVDDQTGQAWIVTAHHVVADATGGITVTAGDGTNVREYEAAVVDSVPIQDLALLSICCSLTFQAANMDGPIPERGDTVMTMGYGEHRRSMAIYRGSVVGARELDGAWRIGTDGGAYEGDSGGPMVNEDGQVVGVMLYVQNLSRLSREARELYEALGWVFPHGAGVAISSQDVVHLLWLNAHTLPS